MRFQVLAFVVSFTISAYADAAVVKGKVMFLKGDGPAPVVNQTVVHLDPAGHAPKRPASNVTMSIRGGTLEPRVLVVPAGSTVTFRNDDSRPHHLLSSDFFDLGPTARGKKAERTFGTAAVMPVGCSLHAGEAAVVLVMETPWYGFADHNGNFAFDVPPGTYTVTAWNEHAGGASSEIELADDGTVTGATLLTIDARKRDMP